MVTPVWLNAELLNFAPLPTGVAAMLEPVPTWQLSQPSAPIGMWLLGGPTMLNPLAGIANVGAFVALWHCAQLAVVDGALAWITASVGITEKSGFTWHASHAAVAEVGLTRQALHAAVRPA